MPLMDFVNNAWFCLYHFLLRPLLKWTLRQWTGQCELFRITYQKQEGYCRTAAIEKCLELSKVPAVRRLAFDSHVDAAKAVIEVKRIKDIKVDAHSSFTSRFRTCLEQITGYKDLMEEVEACRRMPFSDDNDEHEYGLMQLWNKLEPNRPLSSRISKDWQHIGFQGDDPKTDFRGMGILGLDNLLYFIGNHPAQAREVYSHSHHPKFGYSFAIVGINLTALTYQLLFNRCLRPHFYNAVHAKPQFRHFHAVYCHLFFEFDKFYLGEEPADIMQFNIIKKKFQDLIVEQSKSEGFQFQSVFTESV